MQSLNPFGFFNHLFNFEGIVEEENDWRQRKKEAFDPLSNDYIETLKQSCQFMADVALTPSAVIHSFRYGLHQLTQAASMEVERIVQAGFKDPHLVVKELLRLYPSGSRPLFLMNIGNSCYIDAVLQVLLSVEDVRRSLKLRLSSQDNCEVEQRKLIASLDSLLQADGACSEAQDGHYASCKKNIEASLVQFRDAIFASGLRAAEFPLFDPLGPEDLIKSTDSLDVIIAKEAKKKN